MIENINGWIKSKIKKWLGGSVELHDDPTSVTYNFINDTEAIKRLDMISNYVWYSGSSNELLNFYTSNMVSEFYYNPIYNRNMTQYYWALSVEETNIKRTHSGVPRAIVDTLVNAVGTPNITAQKQYTLQCILDDNSWKTLLNQQQLPLTMVGAYGAFKIDVNPKLSKYPIISYYNSLNCDFIRVKGRIIAIMFKDYYRYKDKDYMLIDTRRVENGNSIIEYDLFEVKNKNPESQEMVPLSTIPELGKLKNIVISNYRHMLAVPCEFFFDKNGEPKSIFSGKIDLFDDLDQVISQASSTVRKSTPIEYFPADLLTRDAQGRAKLPKRYDREYLKFPTSRNGDGTEMGEIKITQPDLKFDQYDIAAQSLLNLILSGILSPATMGFGVERSDNSVAMREKEKTTMMTRNNIITREEQILKELCNIVLAVEDYIEDPSISEWKEYDVSVQFGTFANETFENKIVVLGQALQQKAISPELFVEKMYGDTMDDWDKKKETEYIDKSLNQSFQAQEMFGNNADVTAPNKYDENRNENNNMDGSTGKNGGVAESGVKNEK